jgi:hypothetical protein
MSAKLPELEEQAAPPEIAAHYAEIKASQAVPQVALIYRHIATIPGALPWAWRVLGPAMRAGDIPRATPALISHAELPRILPFGADTLSALDVGPVAHTAILYILASYNTANANNLIAARVLRGLLNFDAAQGEDDVATAPPTLQGQRLPALPILIGRDDMGADLWQALAALRSPSGMADNPIVPSLYRHLAHWPAFLKEAAVRLRPPFEGGEIERCAQAVDQAAAPLVEKFATALAPNDGTVGRPTGDERKTLVTTLGAFVETIPELIVAGTVLAYALTSPDEGSA